MRSHSSGIILTADKADVTICEVFGDLPTALIPVNGKPIIFFILQQFLENGIYDVYIGVDYKKDKLKEVVDLYFATRLNINYIYTDKMKAPGDSLLEIIKHVRTKEVVINLGDTFIKDLRLDELSDQVVVSKDFVDEQRWATVKVCQGCQIEKFQNKVQISNQNIFALCGVYKLNNISKLDAFETDSSLIQINEILDFYNRSVDNFSIYETLNWLDFGHIDKYYVSKKRLIQSRGFNSLEYNDLLGTITKKSKNVDKFLAEISWQINLPANLEVLSPRVLRYAFGDEPFIEMEFYSYPTIAEIWLFSELNDKVYFSIIEKIFKVLELFLKNKQSVARSDYRDMYIEKTLQRVKSIKNESILKLLKNDTIVVNGTTYKNWPAIECDTFNLVDRLYHEEDNCFIHGDFCLSNVLYDLRSGIARLIDPRGVWGSSENGDIKYDVAKLRHSICSDYDYIVNDLFYVETSSNTVSYYIFNSKKDNVKSYFDEVLSRRYCLDDIKLIEGLLFLSMISLHGDNEKRQIMMYIKAIELLNNVVRPLHENPLKNSKYSDMQSN